MNYLALIFVAVAGIALGMYLARRNGNDLIAEQTAKKTENKQKILAFVQEHSPTSQSYEGLKKIRNNDVEKLIGVSDATAERYLNELEKEGELAQHGATGQGVFYTLK